MNTWFECKVKYNKMDEKGKCKMTTDTYLINAMTFTEAEARITQELSPYISGEFMIVGMKKAAINEIFPHDEGDRWFRCKVMFISIDEVKATEKKISSTILVFASTIEGACKHLQSDLSDSMADYELASVAETNIMDIFPYSEDGASMHVDRPAGFVFDAKAEQADVEAEAAEK